jgi:glycosyltransferase involved in cell wall biosynthesis
MLSKKDHKVIWWTSNFFHITKHYRCPRASTRIINENLTVKLLPTPSYKNNIGLARVYNHYIYSRRFENEALKTRERPDVILASLPPLDSASAVVRIGKKLNSKIVIDIQDLWPDVFIFLFPKYLKPIAKLLFYRLFQKANSIYKKADALIAVSTDYLERGLKVCKNSKPTMVLHLGIDLNFFDNQVKPNNFFLNKRERETWITYIGTLGRTYDLETILETATYFSDNPDVRFIIAGDGPEYTQLKKKVLKKGIPNIVFTGMLGYPDLTQLLSLSAVGISAYAPGAPQTFPNKVFDYLAAGLPVINSIPRELQRLLKEEEAGLQYEAGNYRSLIHAIEKIINDEEKRKDMGKNARRLVEERFDRNREYLKLEKFLENL